MGWAMIDNGGLTSVPPFPPEYRASGLFLHVTSLPSPYGIGDVTTSSRRGYFGLAMSRAQALFVRGSSIFGDNAGWPQPWPVCDAE